MFKTELPQALRSRDCMRTLVKTRLLLALWLALATAQPLAAELPDRQAAEWTILMGGSVCVEGQPEQIRELRDLPTGDFHLELVDLVGTNIVPPDLQRLSGL